MIEWQKVTPDRPERSALKNNMLPLFDGLSALLALLSLERCHRSDPTTSSESSKGLKSGSEKPASPYRGDFAWRILLTVKAIYDSRFNLYYVL
jgi:hypothetical protein